ncbi:MAG: DUF3617 family protein [Burkholderiaceae bacterium]
MRTPTQASLLLLGLLLAAPTLATEPVAPAGPTIQPGLWESTRGGDLKGLMAAQIAEAEAGLATLPEAQREAIRATMKTQLADLAKPRRACMSEEQARHFWRDQMRDATCRRSIRWTAPGQGEMTRHCGQGRTETTAITVVDGQQVTMALSGSTAAGRPIELTMTLRRIGDDCASAKPR